MIVPRPGTTVSKRNVSCGSQVQVCVLFCHSYSALPPCCARKTALSLPVANDNSATAAAMSADASCRVARPEFDISTNTQL